jgi:peptidoglycan hydrolase-like protein with peptidoglycan-binding domain
MANRFNYKQIQGVEGNPNVSDDFVKAVEKMANALETKPEYVLAAMSFETGSTFSPSIQNGIGATGLIQFLKSTAKGLGTTTDKLKAMSAVEQLEFVEKYFHPFKGKLSTLEAVYTSILSGSPKKPDEVLFKAGTPAYKMNPLDWNNDGKITAAEATTIVGARLFGGVTVVQQKLINAGFVPDEMKERFADGRWGKDTSKILAKFQKSKKLAETGLMDEATGAALFGKKPEKETKVKILEKGASGKEVEQMQEDFVKLGLMTMEKIGSGFGKFGPQSEKAVQTFQKILLLPETGKFDDVERKAVSAILSGIAKGNPHTQITKAIQTQFVKFSYMTQTQVDTGFGTFGNQTENACKKFQKDNLLQESGIIEAVNFKVLFTAEKERENAEKDVFVAKDGTNYTVATNILMTKSLQKKVEKVADSYFAKTGKKLVITSGFRPPERQAPAMYDKIINEGEGAVRKLYKNKVAIDEILNAYRPNKGKREKAVAAMTETIEKQVKRGVMISSHLLSNAVDVRQTAVLTALKDSVIQFGGRVVVESNHFHLELH